MTKIEFVICVLCLVFTSVSCEEFAKPVECPTISEGYYSPFCVCRYGPAYDNTTNTCPNPECPTESIAQPSYPNCTCTGKNAEYSAYINDCFQVCPKNSTGHWPTCNCDDKSATFDKKQFRCVKCPEESEHGMYPNCDCSKIGAFNEFLNECTKCPETSMGLYPNCTCNEENAVFDAIANRCESCVEGSPDFNPIAVHCKRCPFGVDGVFPDCTCSDGEFFDGQNCLRCPWNSKGPYGNCICDENFIYDKEKNVCLGCPFNSTGIYPNCTCDEPYGYENEINFCLKCPEKSTGSYPDCKCSNALFSKRYGCIECPANSTGLFPNCECEIEDHIYSAYINKCYIECGAGSTGLHPQCKCDKPYETYYEPEEFTCKSNIGRECPKASIGTGPDCLCVRKDYVFKSDSWTCAYKYSAKPVSHEGCPGGERWPQCPLGIDWNCLKSCVG